MKSLEMRNLKVLLVVSSLFRLCSCNSSYLKRYLYILLGQYIINDVTGFSPSTSGWSHTCTSYCNGQIIIGGYGCFGAGEVAEKTYTGLPVHNRLNIEWDAYISDSWNGENLYLTVNNDNNVKYTYYFDYTTFTVNYCGSTTSDTIVRLSAGPITVPAAISLQIKFSTNLDQVSTNEAFGFKNIKITLWLVCHAACVTCFGDLISQCYSCTNGYYLKDNTCVTECGSNYWNNPTGNICSRNTFFNFFEF